MSKLTQSRLREVLNYDPETGVFTWAIQRGNRCPLGGEAGGAATDGYIYIRVDGKLYCAHRLAWLYVNGEWPVGEIDHKNRDRGDNRLCNLREATRTQNQANVGKRSDNTSGFKGVSFHKRKGRWQAQGRVHGRTKFFGYHATPEAASAAYVAATRAIHGDFAYVGRRIADWAEKDERLLSRAVEEASYEEAA